jgi:hypothetical protein
LLGIGRDQFAAVKQADQTGRVVGGDDEDLINY